MAMPTGMLDPEIYQNSDTLQTIEKFSFIGTKLLIVEETNWKIASSILKEGLYAVSARAEKLSSFVQAV